MNKASLFKKLVEESDEEGFIGAPSKIDSPNGEIIDLSKCNDIPKITNGDVFLAIFAVTLRAAMYHSALRFYKSNKKRAKV